MKKVIILAAVAALVVCSCGTQKQTAKTSSYNDQLQNTQIVNRSETPTVRKMRPTEPCEELAWTRDLAAVGTAISYNEKVARNEAARDARYELGRMMQVAVEGAAEDYLRNVSKNKKSTAETISEEINNQFYAECVKNSKPIKSTTYDLSDGTIQVYVCYEVVAGFDVLEKVAEVAENVLNRDGELEVEYDKERFKGKVKEGLQEYKENHRKK